MNGILLQVSHEINSTVKLTVGYMGFCELSWVDSIFNIPRGERAWFLFVCLFIFYFWLHWVFAAVCWLSAVVQAGAPAAGFSVGWPLLLWGMGPRACRLQELRCPGLWSKAQQLWHTGSAAPQYAASSQTGDRTMSPALAGGFLTTGPQASPGLSS